MSPNDVSLTSNIDFRKRLTSILDAMFRQNTVGPIRNTADNLYFTPRSTGERVVLRLFTLVDAMPTLLVFLAHSIPFYAERMS